MWRLTLHQKPLAPLTTDAVAIRNVYPKFFDNRRKRLSAFSWLPKGTLSLCNISSKMELWMHLTVIKFSFEEM
jgi:hypothetical protein